MTATALNLLFTVSWGLLLIWVVVMARADQRKTLDKFRRTYIASFPRELSHEAVLNLVRALHGLPYPRLLQHPHTVVFDTLATSQGIKHYISIPGHVTANVESLFRTHIPGGSLTKTDEPLPDFDEVMELKTTSYHVPLRIASAEAVAATVLSSFAPLKDDQSLLMQWVILPSKNHPTPEKGTTLIPLPTSDYAQAKEKLKDGTFLGVLRIASTGNLAPKLYSNLSSTKTYGVRFKKRLALQKNIKKHIKHRSGVLAFPCHLSTFELSVLLGFPFGTPNIPGLPMGRARHLAPDQMIPTGGLRIGQSSFPGLDRPLAIPAEAMMTHAWAVGPTGSGKSALLHNLAVQIMEQGMGLVLIEPKADLAGDVLRSVPEHRITDVIWFDPTDIVRPIGFNVLSGDPERTAGHIVHLFKGLFGDSWGARLERILRYSVLTAAMNGLTLYDVKQLLVNPDFRARIVRQTKDPEIRQFWRWLDTSSDQYVDSVVNKLDSFLGSRAIRNIIGQTSGLDMETVVRQNKILLIPLKGSALGEANASMLGSLIVDQLWQQVRLRPQRSPIILMLDEFQNYLNLSTPMEDALAEARSYGLGMVMANQHTGQLSKSVLDAVRANARSKIVFGLNASDARTLAPDFAPLSADDLQTLQQYEAAASLMTASGAAPTATLTTYPPPLASGHGAKALEASRSVYGRVVFDVERELADRHKGRDEDRKKPAIESAG